MTLEKSSDEPGEAIYTGKFPLGQTVATPGVLASIPLGEIQLAMAKHHYGDWGNLDPEDKQANETALKRGSRLLSAYISKGGIKFWIITEADRSVTTVLLPSEY